MLTTEEKSYLRGLAKQVSEISQDAKWEEKKQDWIDLMNMDGKRTLVTTFFHNDVWRELINPAKTLKIKDKTFRKIEYDLLKRIYRYKNFDDDMVIDKEVYIPIDYKFSDWVEGERKHPFDTGEDGALRKAEAYHPVIIETSDIKKLRKPHLEYINWEGTNKTVDEVGSVLGDLLNINRGEPFMGATDYSIMGWGMSMVDVLAELRGLEQLYYDIYGEPEFLDEVMLFMQEAYLEYLDTMEKEHLLIVNNVGSMCAYTGGEGGACGENGLGYTDKLPQPGYDPNNVKAKDLWGYMMEQEYDPVGPKQRYDFAIKYQIPIAEKFGMVAYGCCENNDFSYESIFKLPNLRVVSVPYCSNIQLAADRLKDYVMSWRPLPELTTVYNEKAFREFTRKNMEIMKDNNAITWCNAPLTLSGRPDILKETIDISMEYSRAYAKRK